ncbi:MAG: hypothetical protein K2X27_27875 [Candidatus Obscuribacterales bacterium]|nr:hypothetical protein [Candidatus Obscuribacterales bacterium]
MADLGYSQIRSSAYMYKSMKEAAAPVEKNLLSTFIRELAQLDSFVSDSDALEAQSENDFELSIDVLSSGRRVYCPNKQNPSRNRKHLVRSLLIHE